MGYVNDVFIEKNSEIEDFQQNLIIRYNKNVEEIRKIKAQQDAADLKNKKAAFELRKIKLINKFGTEAADKILAGKIWLGMTDEMAKESRGLPQKNKRTVGNWGIHEQWVYPNNVYLYFENGILTSWQD